jgi:hypothetical protein
MNLQFLALKPPAAWTRMAFSSIRQPHWEQRRHMCHDDRDEVIKRAYKEFWDAKEALDALEAACVEISASSSITTEEGYLMLASSGVRLLDTEHVRKVVEQYHAARQHKDTLRKRLADLGEPDPE